MTGTTFTEITPTRQEDVDRERLRDAAPELLAALVALANAKALAGIRSLVAGWNGEDLPDGPHKERHPPRLGARIETNCGAIYSLDEALVSAADAIAKATGQ